MHRAKHRAAGRASAEVLAATLIERFAVDARSSSTRHATAALPPRGAVAVLDEEPAEGGDLRDPGLYGVDLFGAAPLTGSFLAVTDDAEPATPVPPLRCSAPTSSPTTARPSARPGTPRAGVRPRPCRTSSTPSSTASCARSRSAPR